MRSPVRVGAIQSEYARAPFRDEHRDQLLRDIRGDDDGRIEKLRTGGAFVPVDGNAGVIRL